jgi:hypothetical protein
MFTNPDACSKLDAKSRKCYFIGYRDKAFSYRFWDDQNRKIIRSRNIIFNELVVYKDRSVIEPMTTELELENYEFVNLDKIPENTVKYGDQEAEESTDPHAKQGTPTMAIQRSSRNRRPPQRYSPSLFYILLIDGGERETYDEPLKVENSTKWELAMKDEIDSLMTNQTWELIELPVGKKALHNK